jgi:hypothetical protein
MASGDGFVKYPLSIPRDLRYLVELYQKDMHIVSFNQALRTLLETHPQIDRIVQGIYARAITSDREEQPG